MASQSPWLVVFIGITIVFTALVLLILVFTIFGKIMHSVNQRGERKKKAKQTAAAKPVPSTAKKAVAPAPVVQQGISAEVVAAISAAITAYTQGSAPVVIRSIRKKQTGSGRSAWARAGIADNTRPF